MHSPATAGPAAHRTARRILLLAALPLLLGGCAALAPMDPPRVDVVGFEPLASEGFEIRFGVKLRLQNPNETALEFDGIALELDLNGKPLATGLSDARGSVPRFGEAVVSVPVTISALAAVRQVMSLADGEPRGPMHYLLRGKLAGGVFGTVRFTAEGTMPRPGAAR